MRVVRRGVFETNSSSVHTLTICTVEEYKKWMNGDVYFYEEHWRDDPIWVPADEMPEDITPEEYEEAGYRTYDDYFEDEYLETYEEEYTTPNGDTIVVFGKYGNSY